MDQFDPTGVLYSKIRSVDPENATKIMGCILIQGFKERDLVSLVCGPDHILHSLILKARARLGLSSNTFSTPSSPSLNPNHNSNPFGQVSPRIDGNGSLDFGKNMALSTPKSSPFLSYENIRAGSSSVPSVNDTRSNSGNDIMDEIQLRDYLSFLNESSKNEEGVDPRSQVSSDLGNWGPNMNNNNGDIHFHRRSFSASDACLGGSEEDPSFGLGLGFKPCLYFARGFCKNGENCKFVHGGFADNVDVEGGAIVGSPNNMEGIYLQHEEMMRMKAIQQQQRLAASQFAAAGGSSLPYDKCMNFLLQQQNDPQRAAAAAAMMLADEGYRFNHGRPDRSELFALGLAEKIHAANRQIYLTFPADSTFKDEDVSNYFNNYGPVQDVRIPYQQKRMFGFVTFVHPQTVQLILARGNPHFICDSRVLVKPYKEKGKVAEKRQQQLERGNLSPCSSPSRIESRDPYDLHLGAKMFYHQQEMMMRRKLEEQAEMHQAIEIQRRFMNLQLPDLRNHCVPHHQRSLSVGSPVALPGHMNVSQNFVLPSDHFNQEVINGNNRAANVPPPINDAITKEHPEEGVNEAYVQNKSSGNSKEETTNAESHESNMEPVLPDTLFTSPTKTTLSTLAEVNNSGVATTSSTSECNPERPGTSADVTSC